MYRKQHIIYSVQHYPWFQESTGVPEYTSHRELLSNTYKISMNHLGIAIIPCLSFVGFLIDLTDFCGRTFNST